MTHTNTANPQARNFDAFSFLARFAPLIFLLLLMLVFAIIEPRFLSSINLFNVMRQVSITGLLAIGMTFVILTAGIDLSVGSLLAFAGLVCAAVAKGGMQDRFTVGDETLGYGWPLAALALSMPDVPLLQFDLTTCPLPGESLDAVVLLNVLEHIPDDTAALRQIYRVLKPGGIAVIEASTGPHSYDVYDKLLLHCRRYALAGLRNLATSVGFRIVEQSHLGCFVYPGF